jgi:hypothetical protein
MVARLLDVSSSGVGLSVESQLESGDRLQIDATVRGIRVLGELLVVQSSRMAFGRWRVGCQFTHLPVSTQHDIDRLAGGDVAEPAPAPSATTGQLYAPPA